MYFTVRLSGDQKGKLTPGFIPGDKNKKNQAHPVQTIEIGSIHAPHTRKYN